MSWVIAAPEYVAAAANDLAGIASTLSTANSAAAFPTGAVLAAGADEVSTGIAALFGAHAQAYQAISQQAALFHNQFVQLMTVGAGQYAETEAVNALPMQPAQSVTTDPAALSSTPGAAAAQASAPGASLFGASAASAAPAAAAAAGGPGLLPSAGLGSAIAGPATAGPAHAAGGSSGGSHHATLAAAYDTDVDPDAAGLGGAGGMVFGPGAIGPNALGSIAAPAAVSGGAASGGQSGGDAGHGQAVGSHNAWMYGNPEAADFSADVPAEAAPVASTGHGGLYQGGSGFYGHGGGPAEAGGVPAVTPL